MQGARSALACGLTQHFLILPEQSLYWPLIFSFSSAISTQLLQAQVHLSPLQAHPKAMLRCQMQPCQAWLPIQWCKYRYRQAPALHLQPWAPRQRRQQDSPPGRAPPRPPSPGPKRRRTKKKHWRQPSNVGVMPAPLPFKGGCPPAPHACNLHLGIFCTGLGCSSSGLQLAQQHRCHTHGCTGKARLSLPPSPVTPCSELSPNRGNAAGAGGKDWADGAAGGGECWAPCSRDERLCGTNSDSRHADHGVAFAGSCLRSEDVLQQNCQGNDPYCPVPPRPLYSFSPPQASRLCPIGLNNSLSTCIIFMRCNSLEFCFAPLPHTADLVHPPPPERKESIQRCRGVGAPPAAHPGPCFPGGCRTPRGGTC